ncbi:MAG: PAS domain S-box protein [Sneathiella sp.]
MKALSKYIQKVLGNTDVAGDEPKLSDFDDLLPEWIWQIDTDGNFKFSNGRFEKRAGHGPEFLLGQNIEIILDELSSSQGLKNDVSLKKIKGLISDREPFHDVEFCFTDDHGVDVQFYLSANPLSDSTGCFAGYRGVGRLEDARATDVAHRPLLKTLMQAIENMPIGVLITDKDGIITYINPGFTKITGFSSAESMGKTPRILNSGQKSESFYGNFWSTIRQGKSWEGTLRNRRKNGDLFWCRETISPVTSQDGTISNFIAVQQDVSDEVTASDALKLSEERFKGFADAASDWYWEMDSELRFSYVSEAACENAGMKREEMLGGQRSELVTCDEDKESWENHLNDLNQRKPFKDFSYSFVRSDGQMRKWEVSGKPYFCRNDTFAGYRGVGRDVTESKILEEQLHQSQKMEVVGHLTGGIAHDFNNLLAIILGNTEFLREMVEEGAPAAALVEKADNIIHAANRGANITNQLLMFSRKQPLLPVALGLGVEVKKIKDMLESSVGSAVEIKIDSVDDLWQCQVDEDQLINAILNLAINARDAMNKSGTLYVTMKNVYFEQNDFKRDISKGSYVVLSMRDTGCGMYPETLKKVFEPFFSTKEVGKGTGLGLSMVYGFVKKSGGGVWIDSVVGKGTDVQLYLPRYIDSDM